MLARLDFSALALRKAGTFRVTVILCEVNGFRTGWLD
jgi:hypothetical protein